jgi:predicted transcriptional regulator/transcriptional regulator with XRE-family HTH domain
MTERKIFAGARVKRLRMRLGLSQTQMAAELGVSPSYLNLIERNQRPLTVQVLLKLSGAYGIGVHELSGETGGAVERLKEIFSDPLLAGEIASPAELLDMAEAAPNAARGMARLYEAWREALERLSDLSQSIATGGGAEHQGETQWEVAPRLPTGEVAAFFEEAGPWFPELEAAAEEMARQLTPHDDPAQALRRYLREALGVEVRILPTHVMPNDQARFDRHSSRLFIAERVPLIERPFLMARQAALSAARDLLDQLTRRAGLKQAEAERLCRNGFARRLGEAALAPAARLAEATRELGGDVARLSDRFALRPLRIMARLAAVGAGHGSLPPAFVLVLDASGGVLSRIPGAGFPFARFGPFCARLPIFDALMSGRPLQAELTLPDGSAFLAVTIAEEGAAADGLPPPRRLALIGWRRETAGEIARHWAAVAARPIGVTCRLCERLDCAHRVHAPVTRPAALLSHVVGPSDCEVLG